MRITGGDYKGRKYEFPKGFDSRPTTDFAREALFNILYNRFDIDEIEALDLFSGTGGISFELASRNCESIDAIEMNKRACRAIEKQIEKFEFDQINLVCTDAFWFIENCRSKWDFIFADPPFDHDKLFQIPSLIREQKMLKEDGLFVIEHSDHQSFKSEIGFKEERRYGHVRFSFFTFEE